jgi:Ca-activated chloride channel homolog
MPKPSTAPSDGKHGGVWQEAAPQLASVLRPGDRAPFTQVKRAMRTLQPLSSDTTNLVGRIEHTSPGGSTAIYDAIYVALRTLTQALPPGETRRQALVILSDGDDTSSLLRYEDVVDAARRHGVMIYGVSLRVERRGPQQASQRDPSYYDPTRIHGDYVLQTLAQQTGGRAYFHLDRRGLAPACRQIADELSRQYTLGYISDNPRTDGRFRNVAVRVISPPTAQARTRQGYFATEGTSIIPMGSRPGL